MKACEYSHDIELIKLLLKYIKPNKDCLVNACKLSKLIIKQLIDYRILPDKSCFLNVFSGDKTYSVLIRKLLIFLLNMVIFLIWMI